jgi:hypothetical protein
VKRFLLLAVFALTAITVRAQGTRQPWIIGAKIHSGLMLPVYEALNYLVKDDIYSVDLSLSFPATGKDYWEKIYHYPETGIGGSFWNLGNNDVLGKAWAIYGFMNVPLCRIPGRFSVNYQVSLGGAYLTKSFDWYSNHLNRAMSSPVNIYVRLGLDTRIQLSPRAQIVIETGTSHFSNGKTRSPNYGINTGSMSVGFNYLINNKIYSVPEPVIPELKEKYIQSLVYLGGIKVYDNLLNKKYFTTSLSYNAEKLLSHRRRIGIGADLSYDGSISEALQDVDGKPEDDFTKMMRFGLHISYAARYKRLVAGIQAGYYLYSKYIVLTPVYNKLTVQYFITSNIVGSIAVKSHWGKADCFEYGMGVYW